jgi:hypothetical protein
MSATFQPYVIAFCAEGFAGRQIATVPSELRRNQLSDYFTEIGGVADGEWVSFADQDRFIKAITKTRELGGIVYDLPVKTGV